MRLAPDVKDRIRKRLAEGVSQRGVALEFGIDKATVRRAIRGPRARRDEWDGITPPGETYAWCDGCRCQVLQPCLACQLRARGRKAVPA